MKLYGEELPKHATCWERFTNTIDLMTGALRVYMNWGDYVADIKNFSRDPEDPSKYAEVLLGTGSVLEFKNNYDLFWVVVSLVGTPFLYWWYPNDASNYRFLLSFPIARVMTMRDATTRI